eukprot:TRINITY_DN14188_c0_g2_i1.p1 TRINITY_DN14188_c0_g2~~TRINITY_DN14188_c0_g2_i1.p1  ORF type:complete len:520 (-),score=108.82 TRINITY_DN14188_c0_g2_i1:104-1663(-)
MAPPEPLQSIRGLQAAVAELREERAALLDCLVNAGILSRETFLARLHKRRFAQVRREHPVALSSMSLADVQLDPCTARYVGMPGALAMGACSRSMRARVERIVGQRLRDARGKLYIFGGHDGQKVLSSVERYDPDRSLWQMQPPLLVKRYAAAAAVVEGRLYICGGHDGRSELAACERYDPVAGAWESLPPLAQTRRGAAAAGLCGRLYLCGGDVEQRAMALVECYNPELERWEAAPHLLQQRFAAAAASVGGSLYVCGGIDGQWALRSVERFQPSVGHWEAMPSMLRPRSVISASSLGGVLWVCGGHSGQEELASAERMSPATGEWEILPSLSQRRSGAAVAACAGSLFVCGGYDGWEALSSTECFDPDRSIWQSLPSMTERRDHAAAAVFPLMKLGFNDDTWSHDGRLQLTGSPYEEAPVDSRRPSSIPDIAEESGPSPPPQQQHHHFGREGTSGYMYSDRGSSEPTLELPGAVGLLTPDVDSDAGRRLNLITPTDFSAEISSEFTYPEDASLEDIE